jgi:hypothetical protein
MIAHRRLPILASPILTGTVRASGLAVTALALTGLLAAGCSSTPPASTEQAAAPPAPPLATSFAVSDARWAVVEMGGPAAQHNNFWQLFVRPAGATRWRLATPPGVADNGGLVVAGAAGGSMMTGFRTSQDLTFSPLASSTNSGTSWSPAAGPLTPGLAAAPDALAATPAGQVLALTKGGEVEFGSRSGTSWKRLASAKTVAATAAGRACGLTGLTAAAFSSAGAPMLAASCSHPGTVGIFGDTGSGWFPAGPARPTVLANTALAHENIAVVRLASAGPGVTALLRAGSGKDTSLIGAWSHGINSPWTLSAPLRVGARQLTSTAVGPGGSIGVTLDGTQGETLAGPGAPWRALPALPRWTATLALGPGGQADAVTAHLGTFADYRLTPGTSTSGSTTAGSSTGGWSLAQTIKVDIPYGSSG